VWFRYAPDRPWVLQGYTLRVPVGGELRLEAPSGAGKTTILRLIAGLYAPERGTVRVLGQPPQQASRAVAYLPQAAHLFEGSIVDNLRLLSDASDEAIERAAAESGLCALLATLPMGPETLLTAGASNFSGGQRQLIAWTALMASERPVLLLDEALSQLDPIAQKRLRAMRSGRARTTLFVEHGA
jgi:ATP-binding cassette subfamily B protein